MEACPRGRLPSALHPPHALLRLRWFGRPAVRVSLLRHRVERCRIHQPCPPWIPHDCRPRAVHALRISRWLRLLPPVQVLPRPSVADVHPFHCDTLPRHHVRCLHLLQHHPRLLPLVGERPVRRRDHCRCHVVLRFHPDGLPWRVLRVQGRVYHLPYRHFHHSAGHPRAVPYAPSLPCHGPRWHGPICCCVCRALLHYDLPVDGPVLLCLWIHPHCLLHPPYHLR
mmetsp:Transcript_309/g.873  ORF Transcript_309/g.873 Transcript_309/m.873 type:complete len:225 (-) Transcript_309:962-1636(-)